MGADEASLEPAIKCFEKQQAVVSAIMFQSAGDSQAVNRWILDEVNDEEIKSLLKNIAEQQDDIDGFLYLPGSSNASGLMPFLFAKHLSRYFHRSVHSSRKTFMVAASFDGEFGMTGSSTWSPEVGALTGLVKTLHQEWPWVFTRIVDLSPALSSEESVSALLAEWTDADATLVEVGITHEARQTIEFIEITGVEIV